MLGSIVNSALGNSKLAALDVHRVTTPSVLEESRKNRPNSESEDSKAQATALRRSYVSKAGPARTREKEQANIRMVTTSHRLVQTSNRAGTPKQPLIGSVSRTATSSRSLSLFTIGFQTCDDEDGVFAQIFVNVQGVDPLRDFDVVFYAVSDVEPIHLIYGGREMYRRHIQTFSGGLHAGYFVTEEDRFTLAAKSSAANGAWTQIFKARRIDGLWEWRSVIFDENPRTTFPGRQVLRDASSSGYPLDERKRPILPILRTDIGEVAARSCYASDVGLKQIRAATRVVAPRIDASQRLFESFPDMAPPLERPIEAGSAILCELDHVGSQSHLWCANPEFLSAPRDAFVASHREVGWQLRRSALLNRPVPPYGRVPMRFRSPLLFPRPFH